MPRVPEPTQATRRFLNSLFQRLRRLTHADSIESQFLRLADEAALDQLCLDNIARFKRPKDYVFVDALPKNNYGKVLKTELRARLGD